MTLTPNAQQMPIKVVGSSIFGRHPIISDERTWNMYISDDWLLNFAGYNQAVQILGPGNEGRGLFHSTRGNFLLMVVGSNVYRINQNLTWELKFSIASSTGEVFMDENLSSQVCLVDGINAYIYNYTTENSGQVVFSPANPPFTPSFVTYQNTKFIFGNGNSDTSGSQWWIYQSGFNPTSLAQPLQLDFVQQLTLQTKPDFARAAIRIPSHGNNLLLLGNSVAEIWTDIGGLQVYQRQSSINIDYGLASIATLAASDDIVAWLGINEKSSPAIMVMNGGKAERLSTDGIDFILSRVLFPAQSTGMFYRQDGHVFYILTFYHEADNFSLMYDFTTGKFFDLTDWDFSYHPARQIAYFGSSIYFTSLKQGDLMILSTNINTISPEANFVYEIPRVRICNTIRFPGSDRAIANQLSMTIENGVDQSIFEPSQQARFDLTISKNGGQTYGNVVSYTMHQTADYFNQPRFNKLGQFNQFTPQFRFWGFGSIVVQDAFLEIYQ